MTTVTRNHGIGRYDYALLSLRALHPQLPSKIVFDIGPGDGRMRLIEQDGFTWQGFDREPWGDVKLWDLSEPGPVPETKAGAILFLDVIEHLINPGLALKQISDALQEGGYLILTAPNPHWSGSRANMLVHGVASGFSKQDLDENHHVFMPWPHILERMLNDVGLQIEEYVTLDGRTTLFRADGNLFLPARYLLNLGLMAMEYKNPSAQGMSFGLVAKKQRCEASSAPYSAAPRVISPSN